MTTTLKNNVDPLKHLTLALVFHSQHNVVPEDLQVSDQLWRSDGFNDKSDVSIKFTKWNMCLKICSWYAEIVAPIVKEGQVNSTEQDDRHVEFRVWLFLHNLIEHRPKHFQKFCGNLVPLAPTGESIPVTKMEMNAFRSNFESVNSRRAASDGTEMSSAIRDGTGMQQEWKIVSTGLSVTLI